MQPDGALVTTDKPDAGIAPAPPEMLSIIAAAAQNPLVDVAKMQALLEMQERIFSRESEIAFSREMQAAQSEMIPIVRDMQGDKGKKYASLEAIDKAIRPIYVKHGFALSFGTEDSRDGEHVKVSCDVRHVAGHSKTYVLEGALDVTGDKGTTNKTPIKGLGSSVRYLRRYLVTMIFNLMLVDERDPDQTHEELLATDQVNNIVTMLDAIGPAVNTGQFLAFAGARKIEHIRRDKYEVCMQMLRKKLAKVQEA